MLDHKFKGEKIRKTNRKQKSPVKEHANDLILLNTHIQEEISGVKRLAVKRCISENQSVPGKYSC